MQHGERRGSKPLQRCEAVEIAAERHDAVRAQPWYVVGTPREPVKARAPVPHVCDAKRDVAAADQQNPQHFTGVRCHIESL